MVTRLWNDLISSDSVDSESVDPDIAAIFFQNSKGKTEVDPEAFRKYIKGVREMQEEIGIAIDDCFLGVVQEDREHERTAGRVYRHYVYVVNRFRGVPEARERQRLQWWPLDVALRTGTLNPLAAEALRGFVAAGWI